MDSIHSHSRGPAAWPGAAGLLRPDPGGSAPPHWLVENERCGETGDTILFKPLACLNTLLLYTCQFRHQLQRERERPKKKV